MSLRAIGVDLSAGAANTALCVVASSDGKLLVQPPQRPVDDLALIDMLVGLRPGDVLGLDCPLGWPTAFTDAVAAHAARRPWPHRGLLGDDARAQMRLRDTDRHTRSVTGRTPLSVSADKLGATAMRCAHVLDEAERRRGDLLPRDGSGPLIEVYPAASRRIWELDAAERDLAELERLAVLQFAPDARAAYNDEHCFDALVAALTARAQQVRRTAPLPPEHVQAALREGWIVLPVKGSLTQLVGTAEQSH